MDLWQRARGFAEEAAKRSQEISKQAARRSQELTKSAAKFSQELVTETTKKSKEIAAEASKKAEMLRTEALKRADQIKTLAVEIEIPNPIAQIGNGPALLGGEGEGTKEVDDGELERFGVTEELREFVKGITISTFKDFPMEDEPEMSEVPLVSNVRQDLNEWQARHATLVLSSVKEISKFRFEKKYMDEKLKLEQDQQNEKANENSAAATVASTEVKETKLQSKTSTSSTAEHDLDVFLLGDLGSSDEGPDIGDDEFDDDFDKIDDSSALVSDDEDKAKTTEK